MGAIIDDISPSKRNYTIDYEEPFYVLKEWCSKKFLWWTIPYNKEIDRDTSLGLMELKYTKLTTK